MSLKSKQLSHPWLLLRVGKDPISACSIFCFKSAEFQGTFAVVIETLQYCLNRPDGLNNACAVTSDRLHEGLTLFALVLEASLFADTSSLKFECVKSTSNLSDALGFVIVADSRDPDRSRKTIACQIICKFGRSFHFFFLRLINFIRLPRPIEDLITVPRLTKPYRAADFVHRHFPPILACLAGPAADTLTHEKPRKLQPPNHQR